METTKTIAMDNTQIATQKRKRSASKERQQMAMPAAKRKQTISFFRPWLSKKEQMQETNAHNQASATPPAGSNYHANKAKRRQHTQTAPQRHGRKSVTSSKNAQCVSLAQQAPMEQQYKEYMAQQAVMFEQTLRINLYHKHLLQLSVFQSGVATCPQLPPQQQQFLQQMSLSQQLMIFGYTH